MDTPRAAIHKKKRSLIHQNFRKNVFGAFGVKSHTAETHRFGQCLNAISEVGCTPPPERKWYLGSGLNQRDRATRGFIECQTHRKPGKKIDDRGFGFEWWYGRLYCWPRPSEVLCCVRTKTRYVVDGHDVCFRWPTRHITRRLRSGPV